MEERARQIYVIQSQKDILVEFMKKHPNLQSGKFTESFTHKKGSALWQEVTSILNNVKDGARKDWKQWRKTWQDMKKHVKSKKAKINQHSRGTGGGGPSKLIISDKDNEILQLIPEETIEGMDVAESSINFNFEDPIPQSHDTVDHLEFTEDNLNISDNVIVATDMEIENQCQENGDHIYSLNYPSQVSNKKPKKFTKTRRLENSLKLSQQLVRTVETRNVVLEEFYKEKTTYLKHRMKQDKEELLVQKEKVRALQEQNEIFRGILKTVQNIEKKIPEITYEV